jgi:hypothetical protein
LAIIRYRGGNRVRFDGSREDVVRYTSGVSLGLCLVQSIVIRKEVIRKEVIRKEVIRKEVIRKEVIRKEVIRKEGNSEGWFVRKSSYRR